MAAVARIERSRREATLDRSPKPCLHPHANHQHGHRATYVLDQCRCKPCTAANSAANQLRERAKLYGRYDKYVPSEPARTHVKDLMAAGMGLKRVAALAGLAPSTLGALIYGKARANGTRTIPGRVLTTSSDAILAVSMERAAGARATPEESLGTHLRLQALVALGWPQSELAARLGVLASNFTPLVHGRRGVNSGTAIAVRRLYDQLSMTLPPRTAPTQATTFKRARSYAAARGWLAPLDLDDDLLDTPGYNPHASMGPEATNSPQSAADRRGDADWTTDCEPGRGTDAQDDDIDEVAIWRRLHGEKSVRLTPAEKVHLVARAQAQGWGYTTIEERTGVNVYRHRAPKTA